MPQPPAKGAKLAMFAEWEGLHSLSALSIKQHSPITGICEFMFLEESRECLPKSVSLPSDAV